MRRYINGDTSHVVYDSLHDFFKNTDIKNPPASMHPSNEDDLNSVKTSETRWRFGDEQNRIKFYDVRFDPDKGKKMCAEQVKKTMTDSAYRSLIRQAMTYRKHITYQDHGFRINVPKALSGEDRYFSTYKNTRKPIVKIAINICGSACVDQESFRKIAQTAVPTIYALETAGIATEVYYTAFATGTQNGVQHSATHVKIKSAQQRFNWTTFAPVFTLGSYRESIFLSWIFGEQAVEGGLGRPMSDDIMEDHNNYGYTDIIGLNAVGPVQQISQVFEKIGKKEC